MDVEHLKSKADNATYDIADTAARAAITELNSNLTPTEFSLTMGNFQGKLIRMGRLRIITLYNATDTQTAIQKQLGNEDKALATTYVGNWCLVDNNNNYGSRYLEIDTNGILSTSGTVVRGGFTLVYIAAT